MNIFNSWHIWELQIYNKHVFHVCILGLAPFAYFLVRWSCLHKTFTLSWCQGIPQQGHPDRPICRLISTLLEWSLDQGSPGCVKTPSFSTSVICANITTSSYLIDFILWWAIRQHQDCWYLQIKCIVSRVTSDVFCFNSYSEGREVSIIRIPRHCLYAPLVWKFLKKLFYSLRYCWLGLAPEFVLKLLAAPRFSTSCIFWKHEFKK